MDFSRTYNDIGKGLSKIMTTSVARGYVHERLDAYRSDDRSCMEGMKWMKDIMMSGALGSFGAGQEKRRPPKVPDVPDND